MTFCSSIDEILHHRIDAITDSTLKMLTTVRVRYNPCLMIEFLGGDYGTGKEDLPCRVCYLIPDTKGKKDGSKSLWLYMDKAFYPVLTLPAVIANTVHNLGPDWYPMNNALGLDIDQDPLLHTWHLATLTAAGFRIPMPCLIWAIDKAKGG